MKIAQCITCPLHQHGGVEVLVRALVQGLSKQDRVFLVSDDHLESLGDWSEKIEDHFHWNPDDKSKEQITSLLTWAKKHSIDVFHFHHGGTYGWNSRSWSRCPITEMAKAGFRTVSTNHGAFSIWDFVGSQRSWIYKIAAFITCWPAKLRQVAAVKWESTVSKHDYHAVRRWFFPVKDQFSQIYHSILDETLIPDLPKQDYILCLGTVGSRKGQHFLAEAFGMISDRFPDWRLVIAGRHAKDGTPEKMVEAINRYQIGDRVDVLTDVSDELARTLLAEAAIFGMPSLAEGLGLSLQEALYAKAACVGSKVGGIPDLIIDEKTGILVPPADSEALAKSLARVMEDAELRTRLGNAGREHIIQNAMTRDSMVLKYRNLYQELR